MSQHQNAPRRPICPDGPACLIVRLALVVAGLGVLALGAFHLPSTAATHAEVVTGGVLSLAVAAQILAAALYFPINPRRV